MDTLKRLLLPGVQVISLVLLAGCSAANSSAPGQMPAMIVELERTKLAQVEDSSTFVGSLISRKSITLKPRIAGIVSNIALSAGQRVKANQLIMQVDPEKQTASVNGFKAAADSANAEKENAKETLKYLQATRASRVANVKFNEQEYVRYKQLRVDGAVSQESVDTYLNRLDVAKSDLEAIEAQIRAQNAVISKDDRTFKQIFQNMKEQNVELNYYSISAPFDGVIGDIPVKVGEYVDQSTKLTTLSENRPLEINVAVPTSRAGKLKVGMAVALYDQADQRLGEGKIFFVSPDVSNNSQSVLVKALIPNQDESLRANQYVTAKLIWSSQETVLVPATAVCHLAGQDFVFVPVKDGSQTTAKQKHVELGELQGNDFCVKSGLKVGEEIVVSGVQNLFEGAPIKSKSDSGS